MTGVKSILVLPNSAIPDCESAAAALTQALKDHALAVYHRNDGVDPRHVDLIVLLGGDGYLMSTIHALQYPPTAILGINFGTVGFLMNPRTCLRSMPRLLQKDQFLVEEYPVLKASIKSRSGEESVQYAFNDFVLERMSGQSIHFLVSIDGQLFNRYSGDGIIIATSGGSTAYNLAARGPVIHPGIEAMAITPLYPHRAAPFHSLDFSLLLPLKCILQLEGQDVAKRPIRLLADGRSLDEVATVEISDSGKRIKLLRTKEHRFVATLAKKVIGDLPEHDAGG